MSDSRIRSTARLAALAAAALAALTLAACAGLGSNDSGSVSGTTWGDAEAENAPSLTFESDGRVHGTDGCNRLMGDWAEEGATVTFDKLASTMMFCDGVDTWLSRAATAVRDGDTLTVIDDTGEEIGKLARSS